MANTRHDGPEGMLAETHALTQRVRLTQRGAWFPLLAFAAVTLIAIPFNRYGPHPLHCAAQNGTRVCVVQPTLALWYWPVAIVVAYVAIGVFYVRKTRERGVGTNVLTYLALGVGLGVLVSAWALWANSHPAFLSDTMRYLRPGQAAHQVLYRVASPAGAIGLALLLLAWIERSWRLLALTIAYLVVAVSTVGIGWFGRPTPWAFLPHVLVDGTVLLLGGIILMCTQRSQRPSRA